MVEVQQSAPIGEDAPPLAAKAAEPDEVRAQAKAAARAFSGLMRPVRAMMPVAVALQVLAAAATIVPFIAMAELAKAFLADGQAEESRV